MFKQRRVVDHNIDRVDRSCMMSMVVFCEELVSQGGAVCRPQWVDSFFVSDSSLGFDTKSCGCFSDL